MGGVIHGKAVRFVRLGPEHIQKLHEWLNHGESFRWYGKTPSTLEQVRQKYLVDKPSTGTSCHVVYLEDIAVGYLQTYPIADYPEYAAQVSAQPGDYGLDLLIGRDDLIGRGLGARILQAALETLIFANPDAMRCLIGPDPKNTRAVRCYARCGFSDLRMVETEDGEERLMALARDAWESLREDGELARRP